MTLDIHLYLVKLIMTLLCHILKMKIAAHYVTHLLIYWILKKLSTRSRQTVVQLKIQLLLDADWSLFIATTWNLHPGRVGFQFEDTPLNSLTLVKKILL